MCVPKAVLTMYKGFLWEVVYEAWISVPKRLCSEPRKSEKFSAEV
jgi:hypothetical protein